MLKLIKKYKVFGRTYNVNYVKEVVWTEIKKGGKKKTEELEGECLATFQTINVATQDVMDKKSGEQITRPIHPERMHQTSCHEIMHSWLNESGYLKLDANELFVQQMGNCLAEFLRTVEYTKTKD